MVNLFKFFKFTWFIWSPILIVFFLVSLTKIVPQRSFKYIVIDNFERDTIIVEADNIEEVMSKLNITSFDTNGYDLIHVAKIDR